MVVRGVLIVRNKQGRFFSNTMVWSLYTIDCLSPTCLQLVLVNIYKAITIFKIFILGKYQQQTESLEYSYKYNNVNNSYLQNRRGIRSCPSTRHAFLSISFMACIPLPLSLVRLQFNQVSITILVLQPGESGELSSSSVWITIVPLVVVIGSASSKNKT